MTNWNSIQQSTNVSNDDRLVASAGLTSFDNDFPMYPPPEWFRPDEDMYNSECFNLQFLDSGRVLGFVTGWDSIHIAFNGKKIKAPKSPSGYKYFENGNTKLEDGSFTQSGRLVISTFHPLDIGLSTSGKQSFYDRTGDTIADVKAYDLKNGLFICGSIRPSITDMTLRESRGADWSPDWRKGVKEGNIYNKDFSMLAILGVNLSGLPMEQREEGMLVASGGQQFNSNEFIMPGESHCELNDEGEIVCLIGKSMKQQLEEQNINTENDSTLESRIIQLESYINKIELASDLENLNLL